jgi:hypothetical protein
MGTATVRRLRSTALSQYCVALWADGCVNKLESLLCNAIESRLHDFLFRRVPVGTHGHDPFKAPTDLRVDSRWERATTRVCGERI